MTHDMSDPAMATSMEADIRRMTTLSLEIEASGKTRWPHWEAQGVKGDLTMQVFILKIATVILITGLTLTGGAFAQTRSMNGMPGKGSMMGNGMMGNGMMKDMTPIRTLLINHNAITRTVQDIRGGVRTITTSNDPQIAKMIRTHIWQMKERLTQNEPIRQMDPVFRQLFLHHSEIELKIQDIAGGVRTTETSKNPQVTLLIRQHAHRAVSEFVKYGMPRMMQPTPLPKGYHPIGGKAESGMAGGGMMGM